MSPSCARVCQNGGISSNASEGYRVELVSHFVQVQSLEAFSKIADSMFHTKRTTTTLIQCVYLKIF
jgi:hypothetical protein